jgi:hypothetical protein
VIIKTIVFKSDPIQDPSSEFRVLTGSPESIFFFKTKRCRFSKKTKVNGLQPGFWPGLAGSIRSHWVFFPLFFLQSSRVPVQNQLNFKSTRQARPDFKTTIKNNQFWSSLMHSICFFQSQPKIAKGWKLQKKSIRA